MPTNSPSMVVQSASKMPSASRLTRVVCVMSPRSMISVTNAWEMPVAVPNKPTRGASVPRFQSQSR